MNDSKAWYVDRISSEDYFSLFVSKRIKSEPLPDFKPQTREKKRQLTTFKRTNFEFRIFGECFKEKAFLPGSCSLFGWLRFVPDVFQFEFQPDLLTLHFPGTPFRQFLPPGFGCEGRGLKEKSFPPGKLFSTCAVPILLRNCLTCSRLALFSLCHGLYFIHYPKQVFTPKFCYLFFCISPANQLQRDVVRF